MPDSTQGKQGSEDDTAEAHQGPTACHSLTSSRGGKERTGQATCQAPEASSPQERTLGSQDCHGAIHVMVTFVLQLGDLKSRELTCLRCCRVSLHQAEPAVCPPRPKAPHAGKNVQRQEGPGGPSRSGPQGCAHRFWHPPGPLVSPWAWRAGGVGGDLTGSILAPGGFQSFSGNLTRQHLHPQL